MSRSGHPSPSRLAHLLRAYDLNGPRIDDSTERTDPMTSEPITARQLSEALRKDRGETKRFLAVSVAPLRERIEELERRLFVSERGPSYLATYARDQARAFDAPEDDE
jgi:hypothetical protein